MVIDRLMLSDERKQSIIGIEILFDASGHTVILSSKSQTSKGRLSEMLSRCTRCRGGRGGVSRSLQRRSRQLLSSVSSSQSSCMPSWKYHKTYYACHLLSNGRGTFPYWLVLPESPRVPRLLGYSLILWHMSKNLIRKKSNNILTDSCARLSLL